MERSLLDSSPSTRHYVRRPRRGSIVSTDSERTISATMRVSTPSSPLHESSGTALTLVIMAPAVSAAAIVQESETTPAAVGEVPGNEEVTAHIPDASEGNNIVDSTPINENLVIGTDSSIDVVQVEHAEVAASEDPVQADVIPGSDVPVIEEELA